jgi:BolA family transcriptional regulator, general stress-responsive regulator
MVGATHCTAMSKRADRITRLLRDSFAPATLTVTDDSHRHAGHAGAAPGGETHYTVLMVAEEFRGQTRIARSRAVHAVLAGELAGGLHALALTLRTPEEAERQGG